jgi:hypothetical protein
MTNPTHGPINRDAILAKPIESLMESGIEPTPLQREQHANSLVDAQSIADLVKAFRFAVTIGFDPTVSGLNRQTALGEARTQIISLDRRMKAKEGTVEANLLLELSTALQEERQSRRDVMHYMVRPDSSGEVVGYAALRLYKAAHRVEDIVRIFETT